MKPLKSLVSAIICILFSFQTFAQDEAKMKLKKTTFDKLQPSELVNKLYNYIFEKKAAHIPLNKGQQAIYYISKINEEIASVGFVDFFLKNKGKFNQGGLDGLELIGDSLSYNILNRAVEIYQENESIFAETDPDLESSRFRTINQKLELETSEYTAKEKKRDIILSNYIKRHHSMFVNFTD